MSRLALTLPYHEYEPPYSYVSRLAVRNGWSFAESFVADMGTTWQEIWRGDDAAIRKMARIASQDPAAMLKYNLSRTPYGRFALGQERLRWTQLDRSTMRVCPSCLMEDRESHGKLRPHCRVHWVLSHYRVCSVHRIPLIELPKAVYPRCRFDAWQRINDNWCSIEEKAEKAGHMFGTRYSNYVVNRLARKRSKVWLDQLPLGLVGQFCELFGLTLRFGSDQSRYPCSTEELATATEVGFRAAQDGPNGIWDALNVIRRESTAKGNTFSGDFRKLYTWLNAMDASDPDYAPILDVMAEFAFNEYSFEVGSTFLGRRCRKRQNYCPAGLASTYGLDICMSRRILAGLNQEIEPNRKPVLRADYVAPIVDQFCRSVLPHEAEVMLGVDRAVLARLVENKLLAAPLRIAGCNERYDPQDITKFEAAMFANSKAVSTLSEDFASMRNLRTMYSLRLDLMCQWVLSGSVKAVEHCGDASSFQDIALSVEEVRNRLSRSERPNYSKAELKSLLCINDTTVAYLVRENLIFSEELKNSFNNKVEHRFWPEAIDGFLEKYVPLGLFAKTLFLQPFAAQQRLAKNGVLPVEFPSKCSRIFRRKDLTSELRRITLDWRSRVRKSSLP